MRYNLRHVVVVVWVFAIFLAVFRRPIVYLIHVLPSCSLNFSSFLYGFSIPFYHILWTLWLEPPERDFDTSISSLIGVIVGSVFSAMLHLFCYFAGYLSFIKILGWCNAKQRRDV